MNLTGNGYFQKGHQVSKGHGRPKGSTNHHSFRHFAIEQSRDCWSEIVARWLDHLRKTENFSELMEAVRYLEPPSKKEEQTAVTLLAWVTAMGQMPLAFWQELQELLAKYEVAVTVED